jgi:hypothetical protein
VASPCWADVILPSGKGRSFSDSESQAAGMAQGRAGMKQARKPFTAVIVLALALAMGALAGCTGFYDDYGDSDGYYGYGYPGYEGYYGGYGYGDGFFEPGPYFGGGLFGLGVLGGGWGDWHGHDHGWARTAHGGWAGARGGFRAAPAEHVGGGFGGFRGGGFHGGGFRGGGFHGGVH